MTITAERFQDAQEQELVNWTKDTANVSRILYELVERWRRPDEWLFRAHPHTYQWSRADAILRKLFPRVLWHDRPSRSQQFLGHGRMSYWLLQKS